MGRPITIHRQPLYYCICVCRMYYSMYLCLFTVSHRIHTVQVYFANTNKHTEQTGRRKKNTPPKRNCWKSIFTRCAIFLYCQACQDYSCTCAVCIRKQKYMKRIGYSISRALVFLFIVAALLFFFSISVSLCLSSAYTHSHRYAVPLNGSMCLLIPFRQKRFKRKMKTSLRIGCECYSGVWCVFYFFFVLSGSSFSD